jgi:hypothetical protein
MLKNQHLKEWSKIVSARMPQLSIPESMGLATWSFGMVMTRSSSLTQVANLIAQIEEEPFQTVRSRLKEWYQPATAKKADAIALRFPQRALHQAGSHRANLEVKSCFVPLLSWVLDLLPPSQHQIALAIDATSIGDRFVVLSINILLAGSGIPVAWAIIPGNTQGSWQPHWLELINHLHAAIPKHYTVILTADRGLYADWLYQALVAVGWHPFLRINHQGLFHLPGHSQWQPLEQVVKTPGQSWSGRVTCFKTNPLDCTLLARWDEGYQDPWLILTDFPPSEANALWYGLRSTTECVYRDIKSDGWRWQRTRLTAPDRAERLWLAMAVATLWMLFLGGQTESPARNAELPTLSTVGATVSPRTRQFSCFLQGLLTLLAELLRGVPIHLDCWTYVHSTPVDSFYAPNSS